MNIGLKQLRYIVVLARHRTMSAAAAELGIAQPSLSAAIQHVEDRAGRPLFARRPGAGVTITPFGRAVLAQARQVLRESDALDAMIGGRADLRGELVIDCFEDLAPYCLAPILANLAKAHPDLHCVVAELDFATLAERLGAGVADICVSYAMAPVARRHVEVLDELAPHAMLAEDDPLAASAQVSLGQLAEATLILSSRTESADHFLGLFRQHGVALGPIRPARSFEMQRSLVANGLGRGISYTRPLSPATYDGKPIVTRPIAGLPSLPIVASLLQRPVPGSATAAFVNCARAVFARLGG